MAKTYLVTRLYDQDAGRLKERERLRPDHLRYQDQYTDRGQLPVFKVAHRGLDGVAAWHYIFAESEQQVRDLIEGDPHCKAKCYTYEVVEVAMLRGSW